MSGYFSFVGFWLYQCISLVLVIMSLYCILLVSLCTRYDVCQYVNFSSFWKSPPLDGYLLSGKIQPHSRKPNMLRTQYIVVISDSGRGLFSCFKETEV